MYGLYKNAFNGQSIFILGNGKSLNNYDLSLLKGKPTFCFNRFYLKDVDWYPTFYTVADEGIITDYGKEITKYIQGVAFPFFPRFHPSGVDFSKYVSGDDIEWYRLRWSGIDFWNVDPIFGLNGTVASVGIQIGLWLGFSTFYLLGVDMDYEVPETDDNTNGRDIISHGADINHFSPDYFPEGHRYHYPKVEIMLDRLRLLNSVMKVRGKKMINLNPDSKFRDCEFGDYYEAVRSV